ncbi:MAG: DUF4124 domain-containing protein [Lysobacterales bacterium]
MKRYSLLIRWARVGWLLAALLPMSPLAAQQVYKCKDASGNPVFSQSPCSADPAAVETVDTSRALKTGSGGPVADAADDADSCAAKEQEISRQYAAANAKLERQIAELGSEDAALSRELGTRKDELRQAEIDELVKTRMECAQPQALPTVVDQGAPAPADAPPLYSWHCIAENGVVFYRHDGCPATIRDRPANPQLIPEARTQPLQEMSVRAVQVARKQACEQIMAPEASKRWGSNRDEKPQAGKDECSEQP